MPASLHSDGDTLVSVIAGIKVVPDVLPLIPNIKVKLCPSGEESMLIVQDPICSLTFHWKLTDSRAPRLET